MALGTRILVVTLLALAFAAPAEATHGSNVFSGTWTTNIGPLAYGVISESDGASSLQSLGGQPCGAPTTYYRGLYSDQNGNGVIVACERSLGHLVGRYLHEDSPQNTAGDGGLDVTFNRPSSFAGHYTADDFPGQTFPYSGMFQTHFAEDGCCPGSGAPPPTEEPPPSQQQANPCSGTLEAQAAQIPVPDPTCYTAQSGPARGKVAKVKVPKVGPTATELSGEIHFVDDNGQPVPGPDLVAVDNYSEAADEVCSIFVRAEPEPDDPVIDVIGIDSFATFTRCSAALRRILARYDQILSRRRAAPGAAAVRCSKGIARSGKRRRSKPKLRVTCRRKQNGVKLTIRPRSRRQTLRAALGRRAPQILLGRSRLGPAGPVSTVGVWAAKK
jgi:hypothetical protein